MRELYAAAGPAVKLLMVVIGVLIVLGVALAIVPSLLMLAWNFVMPIFGVSAITFWQAVGLWVLLVIIGGAVRG